MVLVAARHNSRCSCRYCALLQLKEQWEEQQGRGQREQEELKQEVQKNLQLKSEVDQ